MLTTEEMVRLETDVQKSCARLRALGAQARAITKARREATHVTLFQKEAPRSAWDEIVTRATDLVAKGLARTTEQAITRVCTSNPELYARMRRDGSAPKAPGVPTPARTITKSAPELKLEALAKDIQAASKGTLSYYTAYDRALSTPEGRELYATYREHQRQATRR